MFTVVRVTWTFNLRIRRLKKKKLVFKFTNELGHMVNWSFTQL